MWSSSFWTTAHFFLAPPQKQDAENSPVPLQIGNDGIGLKSCAQDVLDGQRQLADLRARLSTAQGADYDEVERAYCELAWSTDIADRRHAREMARQLFVASLHINFRSISSSARMPITLRSAVRCPRNLPTCESPRWSCMVGTILVLPEWPVNSAPIIPSTSYIELPGVGHLPCLERPDLLRDVLRHFLEALPYSGLHNAWTP